MAKLMLVCTLSLVVALCISKCIAHEHDDNESPDVHDGDHGPSRRCPKPPPCPCRNDTVSPSPANSHQQENDDSSESNESSEETTEATISDQGPQRKGKRKGGKGGGKGGRRHHRCPPTPPCDCVTPAETTVIPQTTVSPSDSNINEV